MPDDLPPRVGSPLVRRAVIVDVDGVVSPVRGAGTVWGDEVVAGNVFGPVLVSPTLCARLDALDEVDGVRCWWLTSWTQEMRAAMDPFPGRGWPTIAEPPWVPTEIREADPSAPLPPARRARWWKLNAVEAWLLQRPEIDAVAWCDDHLRGGRPAATRRRLAARGVDLLTIAPQVDVGLTPRHVQQLREWVEAGL